MSAKSTLVAFVGATALTASALAFAPVSSVQTEAADGKALAAAAGQLDAAATDLDLDATAMQNVPCAVNMAGPYACNNVDLVDMVPTAGFGGGHGSDSWGWTDDDGTEYVIVTSGVGAGFFRLAEDGTADYLGTAERTDTADRVLWNDVKVVNDHAYISSEDNEFGLQIVDMNVVADLPAIPLGTGRGVIPQAGHVVEDGSHNVVAFEERGIVAQALLRDDAEGLCAGDIIFYDVSETPADPERIGCAGGSQDDWLAGDTHDAQCVVYRGPDADYNGAGPDGELGTDDDVQPSDICMMFQEEGGFYLIDVSEITRDRNPDGRAKLITAMQYDGISYAHQGWLTENHRWVIFGDELDEAGALGNRANANTATYYIDLEDLDVGSGLPAAANKPLVKKWNNPSTRAIDHNMYVVGNRVYQANYGAGLRVLEFSDESLAAGGPEAFEEVAYFDTYPGPGPAEFYGAWNTYPFFASGNIILSDFEAGLLVLDVTLED